ncbi:hypothetical protein BH11PSE2_BH11PSE2_08990 [soil metagenome]
MGQGDPATQERPAKAGLLAGPTAKMIFNLGLLSGGQVMTKAISFVAFAYLTHALGAAQYGAVEYAMGLSTFAALAIDGGLGAVGVRRISQGEDTPERLAALVPTAQLCVAGIVAPGMLLFAWLFANDARAVQLTALVALSVMLLPWKQDWLFQSVGKMAHIVMAQVIRTAAFAIGVIAIVHKGADLNRVGMMEIASVAAATLFLLVRQQQTIAPFRTSFNATDLIGLAREGIPIGAAAIVWALIQYAPLMMLANMMGMAETGYFGAAHRLGVSLVTFSWIYHFNLYPTLASRMGGDPKAMAGFTRASFRACAWGGIAVGLGLTLLAKPLLGLIYPAQFEAAAKAFQVLVWTFPITLLSGHARWILVAARRPNDTLIAQCIGGVTALIGGPVLIHFYGGVGAAASMVLSCATVWAAAHFFVLKHGGPSPFLPCVWPAIAAGGVIAALHFVNLNPWLATVVGLAAFGLLALTDRALLRDLMALIKPAAPSKPEAVNP